MGNKIKEYAELMKKLYELGNSILWEADADDLDYSVDKLDELEVMAFHLEVGYNILTGEHLEEEDDDDDED